MAMKKRTKERSSSLYFSTDEEFINTLIRNVDEDPSPNPIRWLVLSMFCCCCFTQIVILNTWGSISRAAVFAYQTWNSGSMAMFSNWGSVCTVLLVGPVCWLLDKKGLKYSCVLASGLCCFGAGLRCLPVNEYLFTWLAHIGAIFNATGGVIFSLAVLSLSSTWFPANQRTSATGFVAAMSYLAMAATFMIGPAFVSSPSSQLDNDSAIDQERMKIIKQIKTFLFTDFGVAFIAFMALVFIFPKNPRRPPSRSSCISISIKRNFKLSIFQLLRNGNVWLLGMSAFFNFGMSGPWLSQLTVLLSGKGLSEDELSKLGTWTILSSGVLGASLSRASDMFPGKLKIFLLTLMTIACIASMRLLYILEFTPEFNKYELVTLIILGFSATCSTSPLFYELAAELVYPLSEVIVAGFIMTFTNIPNIIIYSYLSHFPQTAFQFMTYGLVVNTVIAITLMFTVEEQYNRSMHDA